MLGCACVCPGDSWRLSVAAVVLTSCFHEPIVWGAHVVRWAPFFFFFFFFFFFCCMCVCVCCRGRWSWLTPHPLPRPPPFHPHLGPDEAVSGRPQRRGRKRRVGEADLEGSEDGHNPCDSHPHLFRTASAVASFPIPNKVRSPGWRISIFFSLSLSSLREFPLLPVDFSC